jgi:D-beta-D-heptose 7-phosphate kinase/D-beta-D-heptose 1-phosphate adenosyltransferase
MTNKVLLIGDSCTDIYHYGTIDRISPEAPIPVLLTKNLLTCPGMAANVYNNLKAFGVETDFITNEEPITKTRFLDIKTGQHLLRVDKEKTLDEINEFPKLDEYVAIVISDYNKGFLPYSYIVNIIEKATVPVFLDTKKQDLKKFNKAIVKINDREFKNRTSDCDNIIVTLGANGVLYKNNIIPAPKVEVFDVCGAGDTFLAALVCKYINSKNMIESINFANKAAAITVQHSGVYSLTKKDLMSIS